MSTYVTALKECENYKNCEHSDRIIMIIGYALLLNVLQTFYDSEDR